MKYNFWQTIAYKYIVFRLFQGNMHWIDGNRHSISNWDRNLHKMHNLWYNHKNTITGFHGNCSAMLWRSTHVSYTSWILIPCDQQFFSSFICEMHRKPKDTYAIGTRSSMSMTSLDVTTLIKPTSICPPSWTYIMGSCYKVCDENECGVYNSSAPVYKTQGIAEKIKRYIYAYLEFFHDYCPVKTKCCKKHCPHRALFGSRREDAIEAGMCDCCSMIHSVKVGTRCRFVNKIKSENTHWQIIIDCEESRNIRCRIIQYERNLAGKCPKSGIYVQNYCYVIQKESPGFMPNAGNIPPSFNENHDTKRELQISDFLAKVPSDNQKNTFKASHLYIRCSHCANEDDIKLSPWNLELTSLVNLQHEIFTTDILLSYC